MIVSYLFVLLLCELPIREIYADGFKPPKKIKIYGINTNTGKNVNLIKMKTFLANENLPIWNVKSETLESVENVMKDIGPFSIYWDRSNTAAAIYFHNTHQLDGTIGHHHVMRHLVYDPSLNKVEPTDQTLFESEMCKHNENRLDEGDPVEKEKGVERSRIRSLGKYPNTVYLEILVIINHDLTEELDYDNNSIVTYVLTLFNTIDMLFSKIQKPNININIAGIIIANDAFPRFNEDCCVNHLERIHVDTGCVREILKHILYEYRLKIPTDSYDIVVFLTRHRLYRMSKSKPRKSSSHSVLGVSYIPNTSDKSLRLDISDIPLSIVTDVNNFERFPTLAHEIAHTIGAEHDGGSLWKANGKCDAHLMKKDKSYCKKCLSFGGRTPKLIKRFFGSRDACVFYNKPRSLNNPSEPQLFWKESHLCQCYGFKTSEYDRSHNTIPNSVDCKSRLRCKNKRGFIETAGYYTSGVPCDEDRSGKKVCWNQECVNMS